MNMVLFGDGHSNVEQMDSLAHPINGKYDIAVSNIPYSQKTEEGHYYPIPSEKGDSVCLQHIWDSLKPNGRGAVIVPETFLYEKGVIGKTRELIARQASELSVISLPRGVFMPYTPTKTNILYFKKGGGQFRKCYFFVIHNDGFELNTRRKPVPGSSDLKECLGLWDDPESIKGVATLQERDMIEQEEWNLRPFFYMEDIPEIQGDSVYLCDGVIEEVKDEVHPNNQPDKEFALLKVSKEGVSLEELLLGKEATQSYKQVRAGDIAYNPYRVNIGSVGVVPEYLDRALVSPAYVVIRMKEPTKYPPNYLVSVLKQSRYLRVIMNYSLSSARASLPFSELARIKVPQPTKKERSLLEDMEKNLQEKMNQVNALKEGISNVAKIHVDPSDENPFHLEDFNAIITKASRPTKRRQT